MMSLADRLGLALEGAGEQWSEVDQERAVRVMADLLELHSRAALGQNVESAQRMVAATVAQITSTSSRQAWTIVAQVIEDVIGLATLAIMRGLR